MGTIGEAISRELNLELLDIEGIDPFVRIRWFEPQNKKNWQPKLNKAQKAYYKLELETVKEGLRDCTTRHVKNEQLTQYTENLAEDGLYFQPIRKIAEYEGVIDHHPEPDEGEPWQYYGVVSSSIEKMSEFVEASNDPEVDNSRADHRKLGELLGYPECCREFLQKRFIQDGFSDPYWQMVLNTDEKYLEDIDWENNCVTLADISPLTNVMLRYKQIQLSPHIPCSFDCQETINIAQKWLELGREKEIEGIEELYEILSWPMKWIALKGTATVTTPMFELNTNSQPSYPRVEIRIASKNYPKNAIPGMAFPHPSSSTSAVDDQQK